MSTYREVELKLYVPDLIEVRTRLEHAGAVLAQARILERNVRYADDSNRFNLRGIVLRLRQDTHTRLTYKDSEVFSEGGVQSRFEAEVEVSDFDAMHTILAKLGFHPYMIYEKYRTTYVFGGCSITLDEMPYGNFIEIEGEEAAIHAARKALGLENARNFQGGYADLFERVRRALRLPFTDLTFENFEGISVPESAFER
jgi:adenylate cyclase, class 2